MRTWLRTPIVQVCGLCSARIAIGDPVQMLSSPVGHPWKKARCVACAVGKPPADLAALEPKHTPVTSTAKPNQSGFSRVGAVAQDWKQKAGDR